MCIRDRKAYGRLMGSDNTLACVAKGARGFVTNGGGIRDSDECIMQKIPE